MTYRSGTVIPLIATALTFVGAGPAFCDSKAKSASVAGPFWITGYYPAWQDDLKPADIDFSSLTHIIYFTLFPTADGDLDVTNGVNDATANALATAAHRAGKKVIICVGGDGAAAAYREAIKAPARDELVNNIVDWVETHNYDGVDIDFEPMKRSDAPDFQAFIRELRAGLNRLEDSGSGHKLITAAVECQGAPATFGAVQDDFDQINLMTYDMAGSWSAETWYNSPLTNSASVTNAEGDVLPSTEAFVAKWLKGVSPSKFGIGICFEGRVWHDADGVNQPRDGAQVETVSYATIMDRYYSPDRYRWDDHAKASSLVIPDDAPGGKALVVYDDIRDIKEKIAYARKNHLGGVIIWELSEGYRPSLPAGHRHPLLAAIRDAVATRTK